MNWMTVIGLEVHIELSTRSKIFCSCTTDFDGLPNTHCCPVCMGLPGTLPVLNKRVTEFAVKTALALGCEINRVSRFDRKNYFYPDLVKAYQISQLYLPFSHSGSMEIASNGLKKTIRIREIHMEEDAGKLIHSDNSSQSFPDYNRAGVPLIEIVTEPDFNTSDEVIAFLEQLKTVVHYLDVSDCKLQEGSMRVDVNLSVKPKDSVSLGSRTEIKNIGSFKAIARAIEFEAARQMDLLKIGESVAFETRRFDENTGKTFRMRSKETAEDYRYFPEPDIPPLVFSDEDIAEYKKALPEFAEAKVLRYVSEYKIPEADARIIANSKHLANLFEKTAELCKNPREVSNRIVNNVLCLLNEHGMDTSELKLSPKLFARFIEISLGKSITRQTANLLFEVIFFEDEGFDIEDYISKNNLLQLDDKKMIEDIVKSVITDNPKPVDQYKKGQTKVLGFFVGRVMRATSGKADPDLVNKIVSEQLQKYIYGG